MLTVSQAGIGVVTGDQLNSFEQTCDNIGQLRSFTGKSGMQVYCRGSLVPNDGFQGAFYWNATSTATDNGITVIVPTGTVTGAWLRLSADGPLGQQITGALSAVTDANAKAVLTSIISALVTLGLAVKNTT